MTGAEPGQIGASADAGAPAGRRKAADTRGERCQGCGTATSDPVCPRCGTPHGQQPPKPKVPGLGRGLGAPFRGLAFLGKHPRLWGYVIVPLLINLGFFVWAVIFAVNVLGDWLPDVEQPWPAWIDWARVGAGWILETVLWAVGILAALLATLLLSGVVNSPFYDLLSDKVEVTRFGLKDPGRPWSALPMDILRSVRAAVSLAVRQLLVLAVLFPLSFTAVGAPLFAVAGFYYAGLAQLDVTLARKLYPGSRRARWGRRHWALVLGAGLPLSMLPFLQPFGIVGTTLAFLEEPDKS